MCILVFAHKYHPDYKFIFAGNRDEFYERPTKNASIWGENPKILSGIDLKSNGIWLGVAVERNDGIPTGDFVVVTNYRDFYNYKEDKSLRSRGLLALDFLMNNYKMNLSGNRFSDFGNFLLTNSKKYNPLNLIYGNFEQLFYYSNVKNTTMLISPGIHGLSNSFLDVPWPKVHWTKLRFADIINNSNDLINDLLELLLTQTQFDDELLPDTGVGLEYERLLSSIFIKSEKYGTRASTIILVDYQNNLVFLERSYNHEEEKFVDNFFELKL
ncbi:MAG: NRDE family protein [Ignavibacteria bacterium]|nr:NRDE family protein [Ignavibacteria bacterium]